MGFSAATKRLYNNGRVDIRLTWVASTSGNVTQYNIYRSLVQGGPYSLLAVVDSTLLFYDDIVTFYKIYYYVVTATDGATESVNSNEASVTV